MTKTSTERRQAAASKSAQKRAQMAGPHNVDLAILLSTYRKAMAKLAIVQKEERLNTGASKTTLSDIGRNAILSWEAEPDQTYEPTPRSPNGEAPKKIPFRFKMSPIAYERAKKHIHGHGLSVTQVVEAALNRFAQTGK